MSITDLPPMKKSGRYRWGWMQLSSLVLTQGIGSSCFMQLLRWRSMGFWYLMGPVIFLLQLHLRISMHEETRGDVVVDDLMDSIVLNGESYSTRQHPSAFLGRLERLEQISIFFRFFLNKMIASFWAPQKLFMMKFLIGSDLFLNISIPFLNIFYFKSMLCFPLLLTSSSNLYVLIFQVSKLWAPRSWSTGTISPLSMELFELRTSVCPHACVPVTTTSRNQFMMVCILSTVRNIDNCSSALIFSAATISFRQFPAGILHVNSSKYSFLKAKNTKLVYDGMILEGSSSFVFLNVYYRISIFFEVFEVQNLFLLTGMSFRSFSKTVSSHATCSCGLWIRRSSSSWVRLRISLLSSNFIRIIIFNAVIQIWKSLTSIFSSCWHFVITFSPQYIIWKAIWQFWAISNLVLFLWSMNITSSFLKLQMYSLVFTVFSVSMQKSKRNQPQSIFDIYFSKSWSMVDSETWRRSDIYLSIQREGWMDPDLMMWEMSRLRYPSMSLYLRYEVSERISRFWMVKAMASSGMLSLIQQSIEWLIRFSQLLLMVIVSSLPSISLLNFKLSFTTPEKKMMLGWKSESSGSNQAFQVGQTIGAPEVGVGTSKLQSSSNRQLQLSTCWSRRQQAMCIIQGSPTDFPVSSSVFSQISRIISGPIYYLKSLQMRMAKCGSWSWLRHIVMASEYMAARMKKATAWSYRFLEIKAQAFLEAADLWFYCVKSLWRNSAVLTLIVSSFFFSNAIRIFFFPRRTYHSRQSNGSLVILNCVMAIFSIHFLIWLISSYHKITQYFLIIFQLNPSSFLSRGCSIRNINSSYLLLVWRAQQISIVDNFYLLLNNLLTLLIRTLDEKSRLRWFSCRNIAKSTRSVKSKGRLPPSPVFSGFQMITLSNFFRSWNSSLGLSFSPPIYLFKNLESIRQGSLMNLSSGVFSIAMLRSWRMASTWLNNPMDRSYLRKQGFWIGMGLWRKALVEEIDWVKSLQSKPMGSWGYRPITSSCLSAQIQKQLLMYTNFVLPSSTFLGILITKYQFEQLSFFSTLTKYLFFLISSITARKKKQFSICSVKTSLMRCPSLYCNPRRLCFFDKASRKLSRLKLTNALLSLPKTIYVVLSWVQYPPPQIICSVLFLISTNFRVLLSRKNSQSQQPLLVLKRMEEEDSTYQTLRSCLEGTIFWKTSRWWWSCFRTMISPSMTKNSCWSISLRNAMNLISLAHPIVFSTSVIMLWMCKSSPYTKQKFSPCKHPGFSVLIPSSTMALSDGSELSQLLNLMFFLQNFPFPSFNSTKFELCEKQHSLISMKKTFKCCLIGWLFQNLSLIWQMLLVQLPVIKRFFLLVNRTVEILVNPRSRDFISLQSVLWVGEEREQSSQKTKLELICRIRGSMESVLLKVKREEERSLLSSRECWIWMKDRNPGIRIDSRLMKCKLFVAVSSLISTMTLRWF